MKNLKIVLIVIITIATYACKKDDYYIPTKYKKSNPVILTKENPIPMFSNAYTFRGELTYFFDSNTGEHGAHWSIGKLYTDSNFQIGDDLTSKILKTDSTFYLGFGEDRW